MLKKDLDGLALLHDLVPFVPIDRLYAILQGDDLPQETDGAALFADISGFTALGERLADELGPQRGAEELNRRINFAFVKLIDSVDRYHGSVIRFSGDALTAWFPGEACVPRAATAGLAMQSVMQAIVTDLPGLQLKIGIGAGVTKRFQPGDPTLGIYDMLTGPPIEQMAAAEGRAEPGQVVLSPETSARLGEDFEAIPLKDGFTLLEATIFVPDPPEESRWPSIRWMDHLEAAWGLVEACRPYLPAPVYERVRSGHGAYVADLRTVSSLFVRFTGLEYHAPGAGQHLDELVRTAQGLILQHGGHLSEVGLDDKGSTLVALFGAPVALEMPATQAAHCAAALQKALPHVTALHCGLTCGQVFAGTVGSPMRRAYTVIGNEVNLAARLMTHAGPGEVLADARTYQMAEGFAWTALPPMRLKGKVAPVRVYRLIGPAEASGPARPSGLLLQRTEEMEALRWVLEASTEGHCRVLLMIGEAGLGKSRLLSELAGMLQAQHLTGFLGAGRSLEGHTPYRAWRDLFSAYFGLDAQTEPDARRTQVQDQVTVRLAQVAHISPAWNAHAPLLNDVLPLDLPENRLTDSLEPAQRNAALVNLVVALLRAWLTEEALVLVLDNAQWLDALSWDLAAQVARHLADLPLTLVLAMRPPGENAPPALQELEALPYTRQLHLKPLDAADVLTLAAAQLGVEALPSPVARIILEKAGGNPFFTREIVSVLLDGGILRVEGDQIVLEGDPESLYLPDTVQGVIRSRIDRLPPDQHMLLKVAAVIGPQFPYRLLRDVQPLLLSDEELQANLEALEAMGVQRLETDGDALFGFRHAITRDVAYGSLLFSQRQQLHRAVAQWYEQVHRDNLPPLYPVLVHHWRQAEDPARERHYAWLAGLQAAGQYANDDAIAYLERALALTLPHDFAALYEVFARLEALYHLRADRIKQRLALTALSAIAEDQDNALWQASAGTLWARYHDDVAEYEAVIRAAERAFVAAQQADDRRMMGLSSVYRGLGLMRLGHHHEASAQLAQAIVEEDDSIEARRLNMLGVTLTAMNRYDEAQVAFQQALDRSRAAGDQVGVGRALRNLGLNDADLGDYEQAVEHYQRSLAIRQAVGDRQGVAATLNDLGGLALGTGDFEMAGLYFEQARRAFQATGDRGGEAAALNRMGKLAYERSDHEAARTHLQRALSIQREIGDRRGVSFSLIDLGLTEIALDELAQAEVHMTEALLVGEELGQEGQTAIVLAGWGLLALKLGNTDAALEHAQMTRLHIANTPRGLAQLDYPLDVGLICYQILKACGAHEQARDILQQAYALMMARAGRITDPERQARYLMTVPNHRDLVAVYQREFAADRTRALQKAAG